jgi:hypothetical protein
MAMSRCLRRQGRESYEVRAARDDPLTGVHAADDLHVAALARAAQAHRASLEAFATRQWPAALRPPARRGPSRRRMVEAAGVERELAGFCKYLMVLGFWANSRRIND